METSKTECPADDNNEPLIPWWKVVLVGCISLGLMIAAFWLAFKPHGFLGMNHPDVAAQVCFFLSFIVGCEAGAVIENGRKPLTGEAGRKSW